MDISRISNDEQQALRRAMKYWAARWDWECPTLLGIELDELKRVLEHWPVIPPGDETTAVLAASGALRELLYGPSAHPSAAFEQIGISYDEAILLIGKLAGNYSGGVERLVAGR